MFPLHECGADGTTFGFQTWKQDLGRFSVIAKQTGLPNIPPKMPMRQIPGDVAKCRKAVTSLENPRFAARFPIEVGSQRAFTRSRHLSLLAGMKTRGDGIQTLL
jgi:hypothetical protein